jgi:glutamate-1-semialdehyde 2,1-aminomutase
MAELIISMVPSIEKVRMVTQELKLPCRLSAWPGAIPTGLKIIKFEGCYHGHGDSFLIAAGSGAVTTGVPDSAGVTRGTASDTLTAPYNDLQAVKNLIEANQGNIAAIIIEPVAGHMGPGASARRLPGRLAAIV